MIVALEDQDVIFLPMTVSHAARKLETPIAHKDPFDEFLLVQAQEEASNSSPLIVRLLDIR